MSNGEPNLQEGPGGCEVQKNVNIWRNFLLPRECGFSHHTEQRDLRKQVAYHMAGRVSGCLVERQIATWDYKFDKVYAIL